MKTILHWFGFLLVFGFLLGASSFALEVDQLSPGWFEAIFAKVCYGLGALFGVILLLTFSVSIWQRLVMLGLLIAMPFASPHLAPHMKPFAEQHIAMLAAQNEPVQKVITQTSYVRSQLDGPQKVVDVRQGFLFLENGMTLRPYLLRWEAQEKVDAFDEFARENLVGNEVTVGFPKGFDAKHVPSRKSGVTDDGEIPLDPSGKIIGDITSLIYFDGELINDDFVKATSVEELQSYQSPQ